MKKQMFYYTALLFIVLSACNSGSTDPVKEAKEDNKQMIDSQAGKNAGDTSALGTMPSKDDADFMVTAASVGMMEVQLGQWAESHASDARVKSFGMMMAKDHKEVGDKLKALAASKNITLPDSISKEQQKDKEQLQKKKGSAFDVAYINMMVDGHKKTISKFEKEASSGTHPAVKAFANDNLMALRMHLDSAASIQRTIAQKTPPDTPAPLK